MGLENHTKEVLTEIYKQEWFPDFNLEASGIEYRDGTKVLVIRPNDRWEEVHVRAFIREFHSQIHVSQDFTISKSTGEITILF